MSQIKEVGGVLSKDVLDTTFAINLDFKNL